jgi:PAT family beta-lactamase induction signal transducer AmpG
MEKPRPWVGWVAFLYFAQGFPAGIVQDALPVFMRVHGARLADIGLLSLATLPWSAKFLWAPLVDRLGDRQAWIRASLFSLALVLLILAGSSFSDPGLAFLLLVLAFVVASATQDIATDAYTIEIVDRESLGPANGLRVTAYRAALVAAGGLLVALSSVVDVAYLLAASALLFALGANAIAGAPRAGPPQPREGARLSQPIGELLSRKGAIALGLFALTYKLGDFALAPMARPFFADSGFSPVEIGAALGTVGVLASVTGALAGGLLTARLRVVRALLVLGALQAVSNLAYVFASACEPRAFVLYATSAVESFCSGLATAPFLALLMSACRRQHAATQYALLSALATVGRALGGAPSGWAVEQVGYTSYFAWTFVIALLGLAPLVGFRSSLARFAGEDVTPAPRSSPLP